MKFPSSKTFFIAWGLALGGLVLTPCGVVLGPAALVVAAHQEKSESGHWSSIALRVFGVAVTLFSGLVLAAPILLTSFSAPR